MTLSPADKKHLRQLGHQLNPVVIVAGKGLSENVVAEADRALTDHELIKVKFAVGDRELKRQLIEQLCRQLQGELVQTIGHIALIYRKAEKPDPRLSNLLR